MLQEGLANVFKHARASAVSLRLCYSADALILEIADTGAGFDAESPAARGFGLKNMQQRAARVGGGLLLASRPGAGTAVGGNLREVHRAVGRRLAGGRRGRLGRTPRREPG